MVRYESPTPNSPIFNCTTPFIFDFVTRPSSKSTQIPTDHFSSTYSKGFGQLSLDRRFSPPTSPIGEETRVGVTCGFSRRRRVGQAGSRPSACGSPRRASETAGGGWPGTTALLPSPEGEGEALPSFATHTHTPATPQQYDTQLSFRFVCFPVSLRPKPQVRTKRSEQCLCPPPSHTHQHSEEGRDN